jgi:hypothetical protein
LQNSTYTTWRDRTWDGGWGHDLGPAMTGQHQINSGLGNLAPQNLFINSLDPAYFQDAALLLPGQELLQQMSFFFRSQVLIIPSSRTGAFQYSFSLPEISGWQLTHRPTAPARCRRHQELFKAGKPGPSVPKASIIRLYLPCHTGWRLAIKAPTPSLASSEVHNRAKTSLL